MLILGNNGELYTSDTVKVIADYTCSCGLSIKIDLNWPKGVSSRGEVNVSNMKCSSCGSAVVIGNARHEVVDGKLISTPL